MAKAPAFQFYARDALTDRELQKCDWITRGIWFHMLCWMWLEAQQGVLIGPNKELCKSLNVHHKSLKHFIKEATMYDFCDIEHDPETGVYTIKNRRMHREWCKKRQSAGSSQRYRDAHKKPESDAKVTPPSATASATASADVSRDVSPEAIPEGPKGWVNVACGLTQRHMPDEGTELHTKCMAHVAACFAKHGNRANDVLSKVLTANPGIQWPSGLLSLAAKGSGETLDEEAERLFGEEASDDA